MFDIEFRTPALLFVALLAPLVFYLASRSSSMVGYSSLATLRRVPRSLRARLAKLPAALLALAVASLAVALAGPRTPDAQTRISRDGVAIMVVVDRSSSMRARDMVSGDTSIDRLDVVKEVFRNFVLGEKGLGGRVDDAIGLVSFAGYADSLCPLTMDHGNLVAMSEELEIVTDPHEDGTAIGEGLALSVERLRRNPSKSKVVILLTDGVNTAGDIQPLQAAQLAVDYKTKVYCIGVGTEGVAPVPMVNPLTGREQLQAARVEIDEKTLEEIAKKTGGQYFRATDKEVLAEIYAKIDRMERTEITKVRYLRYTEHFASWVFAGLGLMGIATVLGGTVFRRLP
jgi:Ca-activated chloride channel family protein